LPEQVLTNYLALLQQKTASFMLAKLIKSINFIILGKYVLRVYLYDLIISLDSFLIFIHFIKGITFIVPKM
jgi:hypothetical protein